MLKKSLVSPITLAFGLALTGAVAAQNMIGGQDVSDADWAGVEERCAELVAGVGVEGDAMFDGDTSTGPEDRGTDDNDNSQDSGVTPVELTSKADSI